MNSDAPPAVSGGSSVGDPRPGQSDGTAAAPLRVLYYCSFPRSGIAHNLHQLVQHVSRMPGAEVELACLPSYQWRDCTDYRVWPGLREISHQWPLRRRARFLISQFANPTRLFRRATATAAKIVHLSNINHLTFAYWRHLADRGSFRIVATVHDVERAKPMLNRAYEQHQLKQFYRRADALIVHSHAQAEHLAEFSGVPENRIHRIPFGPLDYGRPSAGKAEIRKRLGLPQDKKVALFFGNIRDEKNLDLLLRSLTGFRNEVHLVVAGRGDGGMHKSVDYYRSLVAQLSLDASVTFMPHYIPDDEVPDLFEASDWVAVPYSRTFTSQSGVLNNGLCYHRPVLATNTATFVETLCDSDVGILVEPDSTEALVHGITRLHKQLDARHSFAFEEFLSRISWTECARQTMAVYQSLLR